jgi:hypothetical protein
MFEQCLCDGVDDDLKEMAAVDAQFFDDLGISGERERNLALYIDFFLDDLSSEMGIPIVNRDNVIKAAFNELRKYKEVDLTDIRHAVFRALGNNRKYAHPNAMGLMNENAVPNYDIRKWIGALRDIQAAQRDGDNRNETIQRLTEEWGPVEKINFNHWLRYYENGSHEKYAFHKLATNGPPNGPPNGQQAPQEEQSLITKRRGRPRKNGPKSLSEHKDFIVGRMDAIRRVLRMFKPPIWRPEVWNHIYQTLSDLEQQIVGLQTESSIHDCVIRTARMWESYGIPNHAEELRKIAQPPGGDVAEQIEKALTGREFETTPAAPAAPAIPAPAGAGEMPIPEDLPMPEDLPPPPPDEKGPKDPKGAPPEDIELPEPTPPPKEKKKPKKDENPYAGSDVSDVLSVLESLMSMIKERDAVRKLSQADMMMDAIGVASYFPELGEAMARMIETNSYVGSRLEKIISKLRGGVKEDKEEAPTVEMEEPPIEETATEVSEAPEEISAKVTEKGAKAPVPVEEAVTEIREGPVPGV